MLFFYFIQLNIVTVIIRNHNRFPSVTQMNVKHPFPPDGLGKRTYWTGSFMNTLFQFFRGLVYYALSVGSIGLSPGGVVVHGGVSLIGLPR